MNIQGIGQSYSAYSSSYSSPGAQGIRGMQGGGFDPSGMTADKIIEKEDADGDGKISAEESLLPDDLFAEIDADQDGFLTTEEIEKSRENKPEPPDRTKTQTSGTAVTSDVAIKAYQQALQSFLLNYTGDGSSLTSILNAIA